MHLVRKFHEEKHLSFLLLSNVVHTNITMSDYETKEETEVRLKKPRPTQKKDWKMQEKDWKMQATKSKPVQRHLQRK